MVNSMTPFTKMHGCGNDFVMFDGKDLPSLEPTFLERLTKRLCHRQFGVGGDGLIVVTPSEKPGFDLHFIYLNADGTWAEMCGNGIRCFAKLAEAKGYLSSSTFIAETGAGPIEPTLLANGQVKVNMGEPILTYIDIPFAGGIGDPEGKPVAIEVNGLTLQVRPVSMGNPHAILLADEQAQPLDPKVIGPAVETCAAFPAKTNVEFVTKRPDGSLDLVVWERGCGFTLACGTGACATVVAAVQAGLVEANTDIHVHLPGGTLTINWQRDETTSTGPVWMNGPAEVSFTGHITL